MQLNLFSPLPLAAILLAVFSCHHVHAEQQENELLDDYREITGVNHTGLQFYNSVEQLYQAADSVCRVVETIQQMSTIAGVERLCLTMQNATRLTLVVGEVVQMKACTWVNAMFGGVAEENGSCSIQRMFSFCLRVHVANAYTGSS